MFVNRYIHIGNVASVGMSKKRYYLHDLEKYDAENDASIIRELEMSVDSVIRDIDYSVQFWKDVRLYGVEEAILYLENNYHNSIKTTWNSIKERMQ